MRTKIVIFLTVSN